MHCLPGWRRVVCHLDNVNVDRLSGRVGWLSHLHGRLLVRHLERADLALTSSDVTALFDAGAPVTVNVPPRDCPQQP